MGSTDRSGRTWCDWARNDLRKRGAIRTDSPRGIWALTEDGATEAKRVAGSTSWAQEGGAAVITPANFAAQQADAAELGAAGEEWVVAHERKRLTAAGRSDLAAQVRRVSIENVAAGYDVRSFTLDGVAVFIEVKTSRGDYPWNFELTRNELRFAREQRKQHRLYRLTGFGGSAQKLHVFDDLAARIESKGLLLRATSWRVSLADQ